jgi:high-affinity iron transporter
MILNTNFRFLPLALLLAGTHPVAGQDPAAVARRVGTACAVAAQEYGLGVVGGQVARPAELREAQQLLGEARRLADQLPVALRADAAAQIDTLLALAERLADPADLTRGADALRGTLAAGTAMSLDPLPTSPISLARGRAVYVSKCAACHGSGGAGDGPAGAGLEPRPAAFTDRVGLASTSPLDYFRRITIGVAGTAMAGYEGELSPDDRWAVALYVAGLRHTDDERAAGRRWVTARCAACLPELSDPTASLALTDDSLAALLTALAGVPAPEPAVAFGRTAGAREMLGADMALAARRAVQRADGLVGDAGDLAMAGDVEEAGAKALEAYLEFERIEAAVGARHGSAVAGVERAFGILRGTLASRDAGAITAAQRGARLALEDAAAVLERDDGWVVLFGQSLLIILREGLEAILIVGALGALLAKAGARDRVRDLFVGAGLAVIASLVTALAFVTVVRVSPAQQEAVEGVTLLLAAVVLFSVASWMVSKIEAGKWKAFIETRLQAALSSRRRLALTGVAFLAVYREGVETVLFYGALLGTAQRTAESGAVIVGLLGGTVVLATVYAAMSRWGMRIPIRPFFAVTGLLLTVMALSFAGQGVAVLQAVGWVPATPVRLPTLPALGVFPTVQTVAAQLLLGLAFLGTLLWISLPSRRAVPAR